MIRILAEAGEGIGFGHLTRTMAIGDALVARGLDAELLVQWNGKADATIIEGRTWVRISDWRDSPSRATPDKCGVLIDSYLLPAARFSEIAERASWVAVLDDYYRLAFPVDLVINPNPYADSRRYLPAAKAATGGPSRVILRDAFARRSGQHKVAQQCRHIVATFGGSGSQELISRICGALDKTDVHYSLLTNAENVPNKSTRLRNVISSLNANALAELFLSADIVISAGGQTLHELACLGVPAIAVEHGKDQILNLAFYRRVGFLGTVLRSRTTETLEDRFLLELSRLRSVANRRRMATQAAKIALGEGAVRIARDLEYLETAGSLSRETYDGRGLHYRAFIP